MSRPVPVIVGLAGPSLTAEEEALFQAYQPLGFIFFARNIEDPAQTADLVKKLRASVSHRPAPVLIDQEGGRVARLKAPHWRHPPAMRRFGELYARDPAQAERALYLNVRLIAMDLAALGIDVDCLPLLDIPIEGAHEIIGDRAFAADPDIIIRLGRVVNDALLAGGVLPIMKHIPGHGRARSDSHLELPHVTESIEKLRASDFLPFAALCDTPWAMTAHIIYDAIDPLRPATISPAAVQLIREELGFDGFLVSDDLTMKALQGPMTERAQAALAAGCDGVLHCSGDFAEMKALLENLAPMTEQAWGRIEKAEARRRAAAETIFQPAAALEELLSLLPPTT